VAVTSRGLVGHGARCEAGERFKPEGLPGPWGGGEAVLGCVDVV
jgi:hypothetical protein